MNQKLNISRVIGLFFSSIWFILILLLVYLVFTNNEGSRPDSNDYNFFVSFSTLLLASVYSAFTKSSRGKIIQISILVVTGLLTIYDHDVYSNVIGEMLLLVAFIVTRHYGYLTRYKKIKLPILAIFFVSAKFIVLYSRGETPSIYYYEVMFALLILVIVIVFVFLFEESNQIDLATKICDKFAREKPFIEIGHDFYDNFIHNYNIDEAIMACGLIEDCISIGNPDKAVQLLSNLSNMLEKDSIQVHSVKDQIRNNLKEEIEIVDINNYLINAYSLITGLGTISEKNINLDLSPFPLPINIVISDLVIIISNVINNCLEATIVEERIISITTRFIKGKVVISVMDNGSGILFLNDGKVNLDIFTPGLTTKPNGTGCGMIVLIDKVKKNNGIIKIYNKKNVGCRVNISFPIIEDINYGKHESIVL